MSRFNQITNTDMNQPPPPVSYSRRLLRLFLSTFYLSAFTFGGGYVIVSLMKKKFVDQYHWIDDQEMLDLVAIAQSSPGAIAVNGAVVLGFKLAGIPGMLVSVLGSVLPPFFILSLISLCYTAFQTNPWIRLVLEGMQAGVSAVIASVVWDMGSGVIKEGSRLDFLILAAAFLANYLFEVNVVIIILACGLAGLIRTLWAGRNSTTADRHSSTVGRRSPTADRHFSTVDEHSAADEGRGKE